MSLRLAEKKGLKPLGIFAALPSPVASRTKWHRPGARVPRLLQRAGVKLNQIDSGS
jgi:hypothetical protein